MKTIAEKIWIKLEIKDLYIKINMYNKELYQLHQKLCTNYDYVEIEEMRKEFWEKYIEKK